MEITSNEFFINLKRKNQIPDKDSVEYDAFFDEERKKIEYGITVNGVYYPGWLYWHTNHWTISLDREDPISKRVKPMPTAPTLRDNEWLIGEHVHRAEQEKKGLMLFGTRRFGKSEFAASYIGRGATIYSDTEHVISGGNSPDIKLITDKCDKGLLNLHAELSFSRISDNWSRDVVLGNKDKKGNRLAWSTIKIRNFKNGDDTEAAAGTTPTTFIMDEVGKYPFLQCFEAAKPGFDSKYGWRCSPILTGTGGTFEYGDSAQEIFNNPDAYNFLSVYVEEENKHTGVYIPGKMSLKVPKIETNLADFLGVEGEELKKISIEITPENGQDIIEQTVYEPARLSNDSSAYPKARMYYPTTTDDCFATDSGNGFDIEAAKAQLRYLDEHNITGQYVELQRDLLGNVIHKFSEKRPVSDWPIKPHSRKDGPITVWEFPIMPNPPWGLYVAGADPYNQSSSETSQSLGSVYIYKRMLDISGEFYVNTEVACYTARPKTMNEWHEQVELLLEWYNAICFPENEAPTFIQYFDNRKKSHYLADGINFIKTFNPTTGTLGRIKGAAATVKNINHMMATFIEYTNELIQVGTDDQGNPIKKKGMCRIKDRMLLKEIINYNDKGNFDRVVAFRHALAYANYLDKTMPVVQVEEKPKDEKAYKSMRNPFVKNSINFSSGNPFLRWRST